MGSSFTGVSQFAGCPYIHFAHINGKFNVGICRLLSHLVRRFARLLPPRFAICSKNCVVNNARGPVRSELSGFVIPNPCRKRVVFLTGKRGQKAQICFSASQQRWKVNFPDPLDTHSRLCLHASKWWATEERTVVETSSTPRPARIT